MGYRIIQSRRSEHIRRRFPSHIRESSPKVKRGGKGGRTGQSGILSSIPAALLKCHIIQPDTSIKVRQNLLTGTIKRILTSLPYPLYLALSKTAVLFLFSYTRSQKCPHIYKCICIYTYCIYAINHQ